MPFKPYQPPQEVAQAEPAKAEQVAEPPKKKPSGTMAFLGSIGKSIASPFVKLGVTGVSAVESAGRLALGDVEGAEKALEGYNVPGFGKVAPAKIGEDIEITKDASGKESVSGGGFGRETLKTLGTGLEIGATLAPGSAGVKAVTKGAKAAKALNVPIQAGLSSVGAELQKEGATAGDVVKAFGAGAVAGKVGEVAGKAVEKGIKATAQKASRETVKKIFPFLTNVSKVDTDWAVKNADKVLPKYQAVAKAVQDGTPEEAEAILRRGILEKAQDVYKKAKEKVQAEYDSGLEEIIKKNPNAQGSIGALRGSVKALAKEVGPAATSDEQVALKGIYKIINEHTDPSIKGMIKLKQKIFPMLEATEQGSSANRLASLMYDETDKELERMTKGAIKPLNKLYSEFKDKAMEIKPIWSRAAKEDTSRNFANSLLSQAKGGSLDAVKALEKIAGAKDTLADEIKAARLARSLNWEKAPTGSRIRDNLVSTIFGGGGAAVGSVLGGPAGALIGTTAGGGLGTALTKPAFLSQFLFEELQKKGAPPGVTQEWLGEILQDPRFTAALVKSLEEQKTGE